MEVRETECQARLLYSSCLVLYIYTISVLLLRTKKREEATHKE